MPTPVTTGVPLDLARVLDLIAEADKLAVDLDAADDRIDTGPRNADSPSSGDKRYNAAQAEISRDLQYLAHVLDRAKAEVMQAYWTRRGY